MNSRTISRILFSLLFFTLLPGIRPAAADSSHARIVRLSFVQGEVRFTRDTHGDPLTDDKTIWEAGALNLPIRQGYVLSTDQGRAAVEFENGAMAFLNENTVLEFYDLSLEDGARTTRLILRQGTASFSVNSARGDYFSVTGGDFTAEATANARFRVDNFDDGSTVNVSKGRIAVAHKKDSTPLEKGQSLEMTVGNDSVQVASAAAPDEFDRWSTGRIDSAATATNASLQYANSPNYSSGFGDLYTYGSWFPVGGYGYGWRPYGVGFGWSPFDNGGWGFDPSFGWSFFGSAPWGWLPYHYGSWIFEPGFGWTWLPTGFGGYGGYGGWRPSTGIWVRSRTGGLGIVPAHPLDSKSKTPVNLTRGVLPVQNGALGTAVTASADDKWKIVKSAPREALKSNLAVANRPAIVSRSIVAGNVANTRFSNGKGEVANSSAATRGNIKVATTTQTRAIPARSSAAPARGNMPSRSIAPPPVPRSTTSTRASSGNSGSSGSSSGASSGGNRGSYSGTSSPRASTSSTGSAPRSSAGSSGGRPH